MTRVLLRILAAALLLVVSGLIGWRVLAPTELSAPATEPYPPAPAPTSGVSSRLSVAPLIVDGRVRVYAAKNQVRADGPVTAEQVYTALWSYRRWPEQLSAVVASGTTVVSRWSDGKIVAVDARTGEVVWRADGPAAPGYSGHRTGAATVWDPPGLRLAGGVVVVTQDQDLVGYDLSTGSVLWKTAVPAECADGFTTTGGAYLCATGAYDVLSGTPVGGWPAAPYSPVGCVTSGCAGFRDGSGQGWLATAAQPRRAPALDDPGATIAAGVVISTVSSAELPSAPSSVPSSAPSPDSSFASASSAPIPSAPTSPAPASSAPAFSASASPTPGSAASASSLSGSPGPVVSSGPSGVSPSSSVSEAVVGRTVDGAALWITPGPARVLGESSGTVLLLSPENRLTGVDARTGTVRFAFPLAMLKDSTDWKAGRYHVTDGFLGIERLNEDGPDDPESPLYYHTVDTVLVAALPR
ncbi:PQQ-binding-like beta-propeller repeat protein [Actinoplanes sp. G11-F43]|uniref:outer membrane protein assembly factor BamB family protein n=1 Tax=Actinoplanes sp. G11-F43 TaxID=3424130 RepID=UPI003D34B9F1